jgi:hypothetical protein
MNCDVKETVSPVKDLTSSPRRTVDDFTFCNFTVPEIFKNVFKIAPV